MTLSTSQNMIKYFIHCFGAADEFLSNSLNYHRKSFPFVDMMTVSSVRVNALSLAL